jgi:hypothetical protein
MSNASFYKGRAKYGCMDMSMVKLMKEFEDEIIVFKNVH